MSVQLRFKNIVTVDGLCLTPFLVSSGLLQPCYSLTIGLLPRTFPEPSGLLPRTLNVPSPLLPRSYPVPCLYLEVVFFGSFCITIHCFAYVL